MIEPVDRILDRSDRGHSRQGRPANYDDRNPKRSRRSDLAVGRVATAVFAHHEFRAMLLQQRAFFSFREWTTRHNIGCVGHGERRLDRIDAADGIAVLRSGGERYDILAADREKHLAWRVSDRVDRAGDVVNIDPSVAGDRGPRRAPQRQDRSSCSYGGICGMIGYDGGVGMGGIDHHIDVLYREVVGQAFDAAKSADPHRHRLRGGLGGAAGKRQRHAEIVTVREPSGQLPCLDRASEYENMSHAAA